MNWIFGENQFYMHHHFWVKDDIGKIDPNVYEKRKWDHK